MWARRQGTDRYTRTIGKGSGARRPGYRVRERRQTSLFVMMSLWVSVAEMWQRRSRVRRCCRISQYTIAVAASSRAHVSLPPPPLPDDSTPTPRAASPCCILPVVFLLTFYFIRPLSSSGCPVSHSHCVKPVNELRSQPEPADFLWKFISLFA